MNLLLDTRVLLWWLDDHPALSSAAREAIADGRNGVFGSAAVIWEIRFKQALGKLSLPEGFREVLAVEPFLFPDVTAEHAHAVADLPLHHRDPFDRMLVAQAIAERLALVTKDERIEACPVPVVDA